MLLPLLIVLFLAAPPPDPMTEGMKALDAQKYDIAAQAFAHAVAADPKDYAAHFHLALSYSLLGRDADAIPEYRKTLELKPGLYPAELNLGMLLIREKRHAEAIPYLQGAAEQKPKEYRPAYYLGDALLTTGQFAKAEESFRKALAIDPKSAGAELGLAKALARENRLDDAAPHFHKAADLNPTFQDALFELAALYEAHGRRAEAVQIYQQFPNNPAAREHAGELLLESGKASDAVTDLEDAVRKSPTAANRLALAVAYIRLKQLDKAIPLLEQSVAAEPDNMDLRMTYGRALRDARQFGPASQQFFRVTQARPNSKEAWSELATALMLLDNYPQALAALDHVKALGGETPGLLYFRAIMLDKLKQYKPALEAYEGFLALSQGKFPNEEFKARQRIRIIKLDMNKR